MRNARVQRTILSVSHNKGVLATRNMVLESQGWRVETTLENITALLWFVSQDFDAAVLGDSIPPKQRVALARAMKSLKPRIPIVMLYRTGDGVTNAENADCFVNSLDNPSNLIRCLRQSFENRRPEGTEASDQSRLSR